MVAVEAGVAANPLLEAVPELLEMMTGKVRIDEAVHRVKDAAEVEIKILKTR